MQNLDTALIIGAAGTIGQALFAQWRGQYRLMRISRSAQHADWVSDYSDESLAGIAGQLVEQGIAPTRIICCIGELHAESISPEKSIRDLNAEQLLRAFSINSIAPALCIKHFLKLLPRHGPGVMAVLSAKVGSIGDNRLGGWSSYRASKAALNMIVRSSAIELARTHKQSALLAIHPGTTRGAMTAPFERNIPAQRLYSPAQTAARIATVLDQAGAEHNGSFLNWDGTPLPW